MNNKVELYFDGTDFSPVVERTKTGFKNNFGFLIKLNGKTFTPTGTEKNGPKKKLSDLLHNQGKQFDLLKRFLEQAQNNIDDLLLNNDLEDDKKLLFDYFGQTMYFGGLAGVVSIEDFEYSDGELCDITLQINTRMDCNLASSDSDAVSGTRTSAKKPYFLMTLLFDGFIPLSSSNVNSDSEALTDMLLLSSFVDKYKKSYVKGYYKTYHTMQRNDCKFKGAIDIARHIRLNSGLNNGKIAYSYKEKGEFNYINHLIVAAYEQLKRKYRRQTEYAFKNDPELHDSIETLKYIIQYPQFSNTNLLSKTSNKMSHPFYTEYEELRKTCIKILREDKISIFSGVKSEKVEGVLMYVPELWEKYIEKFLKGLSFKSQDLIKVFDVNASEDYQQNTRPDFVFYNNSNPYMILDAKFKPGWMTVAKSGKIPDSLSHDYDKCIRDMVSINANVTGVIFPTNENIEISDNSFIESGIEYKFVHGISKHNTEQKFYTFPIYIPPIEGEFIPWKNVFIQNCKSAFDKICEVIRGYSN